VTRVSLSNVNLNLLVVLSALLETRSVSEAARRVRVTKSAVSHSLAALRDLFQDQLLVRAGGRLVLTPRAESLREPLGSVLGGVTTLLEGAEFDPSKARRRFSLAAPDFLATLILPRLLQALSREAPYVELNVVPSARRGNAWMLETGEIDLALGAVVDDAPGIRRAELFTETFACAVRRDHPEITSSLSLEQYVRTPHLVISLGDDERPTWIDEALARVSRSRHVAAKVRYFMAAPLVVSQTELLMTGPATLIDYFSKLVPLSVFEPPVRLPSYPEEMYWHERHDSDPAHRWLRGLIVGVTATLGSRARPERTRFDEAHRKKRGRRRVPKRKARRS
jgi:DNA-binding transcriptional LysR family regulator